MIELLFLSHNRLEFTKASIEALVRNTHWGQVSKVLLYDDDSKDGTRDYLQTLQVPVSTLRIFGKFGSPVAVMNHYLSGLDPHTQGSFAKIDSDTMVPAHWLTECIAAMERHPDMDLCGIEAHYPMAAGRTQRRLELATHIGGIGLMRHRAFVTLPRPSGRFGFTAWQQLTLRPTKTADNQDQKVPIKPGWLNPALPVFLLDRLPREPWATLSKQYVAKGWQREWPAYEESQRDLWSWWIE